MNAIRGRYRIRFTDAFRIKESIKEMTGQFLRFGRQSMGVALFRGSSNTAALLGCNP